MTHLRQITLPEGQRFALREQPAPIIQWVPIASLRIDDRYQRPLGAQNWKAIEKIAANFDWCAFSPILCAPVEGGLYAVIDGQHRAHAAALCGLEQVPAQIVPVASDKQAIAFVQVNSGIRVTAHQTFRAELAAGEPEALALAEACRAAGCEAMTYKPSANTKQPRKLFQIAALRNMIRAGHAAQLTTALRAIVAYDTQGRFALYSDYILTPLVAAIVDTRCDDAAQVFRALAARDPFHTIEAATTYAKNHSLSIGTERRRALAKQIEAAK